MRLQWNDDRGRAHQWDSWKDALCSCYEAVKFIPANSMDVRVSFRTMPGKHQARKVDRHRGCEWVVPESMEVISLRSPERCPQGVQEGIDAVFELRGPLLHCYLSRARNLRNEGILAAWEFWPSCPLQSLPLPSTLEHADEAAPWPGPRSSEGSQVLQVTHAMARLRAAAQAMLRVRQRTCEALRKLDKQLSKQWYRVNSTNSVSAGLAVASFATLFTVPPMGVALGIGSAAMGASAIGGDMVGDHNCGDQFAHAVQQDSYEQLGFEAVESELENVLELALSAVQVALVSGTQNGRAMALGGQTASLAVLAVKGGVRAGRAVALTRAGQGISAAGKVLGGVGAGLAVGVAVHGWSTLKPNQKMVRDKLEEVQRSTGYLTGLAQQVTGALQCPICLSPLDDEGGSIRRCDQFHCFHGDCVRELRSDGDSNACPLCPKTAGGRKLSAIGNSADRLRALLWVSGVRDCSMGLESVTPHVLSQARNLKVSLHTSCRQGVAKQAIIEIVRGPSSLRCREPDSQSQRCTTRGPSAWQLTETADAHEAWQEAAEAAGSLEEVAEPVLDELLARDVGMPLKYRHAYWPRWLRVSERRSQEDARGTSFKTSVAKVLSEDVRWTIEADIPRTRSELVPNDSRDVLRRVLLALAAYNHAVGYAQGMNQLAAIMLKLGFDDEATFWMLVEVLENIVPGCHAQDLHGLFRDIAVADVLVQTFLPAHAAVMSAAGVQLLWLTADYFVTLGAKFYALPLIVRLWDLCFLHGPRALFCGLLAQLELHFPADLKECNTMDAEELIGAYRCSSERADPEVFASRTLSFLHHRQGGVSTDLVNGLRSTLAQQRVTLESLPPQVLLQGRELMAWFGMRPEQGLRRALGQGEEEDEEEEQEEEGAQEAALALLQGPTPLLGTIGLSPSEGSRGAAAELSEDAASHEAWHDAVEAAGSLEAVTQPVLEKLLTGGLGMPLKYRLICWPLWLNVAELKEEDPNGFAALAASALPACAQRRLERDAFLTPACLAPPVQHIALRRVSTALLTRNPRAGRALGMLGRVAAVFLKLGFEEEAAFWMCVSISDLLAPGYHVRDLYGVLRDIAVAEILVQTFLPAYATSLSAAGIPLSWISADYFLTLGTKDTAFPLVVRLWDLCILHGPRALFCGLLARLELFFPMAARSQGSDATDLLRAYHEASLHGDPEVFASRLLGFLHERQGGVSAELVAGLRSALVQRETEPPNTDDGASPTPAASPLLPSVCSEDYAGNTCNDKYF